MLFVAPQPCGTVRVAADCKEAVADCKLNMAEFDPGIADCRCHLPIRNCQVLCIFYAYVDCSQCTCMQGGAAYFL